MEFPQFKAIGELVDYLRVVGYWDFPENAQIKNPPPNTLRVYAEDNGLGKSRIVVRNSVGATFVIWTEP